MKRILLINAKTRGLFRPTGLEYVAEALLNSGYGVDLVDLTVEDDPEGAINERIRDTDYAAIGISIFNTQREAKDSVSFFLPDIRQMVSHIKRLSDAPIILGGAGFTMQPKDILQYVGGDFGVSGCGIPALATLLSKIDKGEVEPGIVFEQEPQKYLDFGFKRDMVNTSKYPKQSFSACVSTKAGCEGRCIYCLSAGTRLRLRDPSKVITEVESLAKQGAEKSSLQTSR